MYGASGTNYQDASLFLKREHGQIELGGESRFIIAEVMGLDNQDIS